MTDLKAGGLPGVLKLSVRMPRFHGCLFGDLPTSRVYLESLSLWHVVDPFENLPSKYTNVHKHRTFCIRFLGLYEIFKWLSGKESACNAGHMGSIPGSGRSPGEGNGNSLQYSCLGNPMGRGAWQATAYGVAKSWTWLSIHTQTHIGHEEPRLIRCSLTFQFSGIPILM